MTGGDPLGVASIAVDAVFAAFGRSAMYADEDAGTKTPCLVMRDSGDLGVNVHGAGGLSRPVAQGNLFQVRASDVASPRKGAVITFDDDGSAYDIVSAPKSRDAERRVFSFTMAQR